MKVVDFCCDKAEEKESSIDLNPIWRYLGEIIGLHRVIFYLRKCVVHQSMSICVDLQCMYHYLL